MVFKDKGITFIMNYITFCNMLSLDTEQIRNLHFNSCSIPCCPSLEDEVSSGSQTCCCPFRLMTKFVTDAFIHKNQMREICRYIFNSSFHNGKVRMCKYEQ